MRNRFALRPQTTVRMLIGLLVMGTVASLLVQVTAPARARLEQDLRDTVGVSPQSAVLANPWAFASAHVNVSHAVSAQQRKADVAANGLFLLAQSAAPCLLLALPLLGLFSALGWIRGSPVRFWGAAALCLGVPAIVAGWLILQAAALGIPQTGASWSRVLVWLGTLGLLFFLCWSLGVAVARRVSDIRKAAWILIAFWVALFTFQSSRPILMRVDATQLVFVPKLSTEVRLSLFRPSGQPNVPPERAAAVAAYLQEVDAYCAAFHAQVTVRYNQERLWHLVSLQLLVDEITSQMLQRDWATVTDVIYSPDAQPASLWASLRAAGPEGVWLVLVCGLAAWGAGARTGERGGVS